MNFRRILVVLFAVSLAAVVNAVEPEKQFTSSVGEEEGSDTWKTSGSAQGDNCYEPKLNVSPGDSSVYLFYEHILVFSNLEKSRCIILKDVPYSGYYDVKVVAMYTQGGGIWQEKEEYRLCIDLPGMPVVGPIINDQNSGIRSGKPKRGPKVGYDYIENDHGFQYLIKGDNVIHFEIGDSVQYTGDGKNNSVDFASVSLLWLRPSIETEPPFTPGNSNTVKYRPIYDDVYAQDVICFDKAASALRKPAAQLLRKALPDSFKTATFSGLEDGHTYGYYIETYITRDQVIRSRTTYSTQDATPPGKVTIEPMSSYANQRAELYWKGVNDAVSGDSLYEVVRYDSKGGAVKDTIVAAIPARVIGGGANYFYHYTDIIADTFYPQDYYQYRIDAMDSVGNWSSGVPTQLVVGILAPKLQVKNKLMFERYHQGPVVTVAADISTLKLPESHFIKYQIARDDAKFLDDEWKPQIYFFQSDWLPVSKTAVPEYTFDLTNSGKLDNTFVDGHRYYIRARFKDLQENYSEWSSPDALCVIPDCFPPEDVPWLTVVPVVNETNTKGWMDIKWGDAKDLTSGVKKYLVFRKIEGVDETFKLADESLQTSFVDSFQIIDYNRDVTYQIRSVDRVANRREESKQQVTAKCQAAPKQEISYELLSGGEKYTSRSIELHSVDLSHFKFDNTVAKIIVNWNGQEFEWRELLVAGVNTSGVNLRDNGKYIISSKVIFTNKSQSIWSIPDTINKVDNISNLPLAGNKKTDDLCLQNYPNPFNPTTQISFRIEEDANVVVEVYNVQGKKLKTLVDGHEKPGTVTANWNGTNDEEQPVASGLYFYHVHIAPDGGHEINKVQSMLLLK